MSVTIVIPARMASTRFPGKPLVDLCGKPMIAWVYERAVAANCAKDIVVATPDDEIIAACQFFGAKALKTREDHISGTDRICEIAERFESDYFINVQGDEPLVDPQSIADCASVLANNDDVEVASVFAWAEPDDDLNPAVVKVVTDKVGFALYFSRHGIPYARNQRPEPVKKHIGIYGYSRSALKAYSDWSAGSLELAESLEQLRFLENGYRIAMVEGKPAAMGVDTPEQAELARKLLNASN